MGKEKFKTDMIFSEAIEESGGMFQLTRQRDLNKEELDWYGLTLYVLDANEFEKWNQISDNEDWMEKTLLPLLMNKEYKDALVALELEERCNKDDMKSLRRMFKTADSLGWFDLWIR